MKTACMMKRIWMKTVLSNFVTAVCLSFVFINCGLSGDPSFYNLRFIDEPRSVVVRKGAPAIFNCSVLQDRLAVHITWRKDGKLFTPSPSRYQADNGSLVFSMMEEADEGVYHCVATVAGVGSIRSISAHLDAAFLPERFETFPVNLTLRLNDTAMFECRCPGIQAPRVEWFLNGSPVWAGQRIVLYDSGTLEIHQLTLSDIGEYYCRVTNKAGSLSSPGGHLTLALSGEKQRRSPPSFVTVLRDQQVSVGQEAFFCCAANGRDHLGNQPRIVWLKDGAAVDVSLAGRTAVLGSGSLHITNVRESDSGTYTCRAINAEDYADMAAVLKVVVPPHLVLEPSSVALSVKTDVRLMCGAGGIPAPTVTWFKDGGRMRLEDGYVQPAVGGDLEIFGLLASDNGFYQCMATNSLGGVQSGAQLVVLKQGWQTQTAPLSARHRRLTKPTGLTATHVSQWSVTLYWAEPKPRLGRLLDDETSSVIGYLVLWQEEGSQRERSSNTTLTEFDIQHLKPVTLYTVRVAAYSTYGFGHWANISVTTKHKVGDSGAPVNLTAFATSTSSIRVDWAPSPYATHGVIHYSLIYYKSGSTDEQRISVYGTSYDLLGLPADQEYVIMAVARSVHGPGARTPGVTARTYSDVPSTTPQNVTVDVSGATSVIVRWQPPQPAARNGLITGYKIRIRGHGSRRGDTVVTAGNRISYSFTGLKMGAEYRIRLSAVNVNGSGPDTAWMMATTRTTDLDESRPPSKPARLQAFPLANAIMVQWAPPQSESRVMVRGYELGYGRGIADVYQVKLAATVHDYTIRNLRSSSQYVITVKAFNNRGNGPSRYYTVLTGVDEAVETVAPMMPPVGLKAIVLTSSTVVLTWADDALGRGQKIVDRRYYTVRYIALPRGKNRYLNATDLVAHIDGLRPDTGYQFSVGVFKGRRQSPWSMTVTNTTLAAAPVSKPRDVTPIQLDSDPMSVSLQWQPPQQTNGQITGYLIFYTTDVSQDKRHWVVEGELGGDKLSTIVSDLSADTVYYFMVQARNRGGYSPMSSIVKYRTPVGWSLLTGKSKRSVTLSVKMVILIVAIVTGLGLVVGVSILTVFLYRQRANSRNRGKYKSPSKAANKDVPPDLWIHQPTCIQLKSLGHSHLSGSSVSVATSTLPSVSPTSADRLDSFPAKDGFCRRDFFIAEGGTSSGSGGRSQPAQVRNLIKPKPMMFPVDSREMPRDSVVTVKALPAGHFIGGGDSGGGPMGLSGVQPAYPRTQYSSQFSGTHPPRVNVRDVPHPPIGRRIALGTISDGEDCDAPAQSRDGGVVELALSPRTNHGGATSQTALSGSFPLQPIDSANHVSGRGLCSPHSTYTGAFSVANTRFIGRVKPQQNPAFHEKPSAHISTGQAKLLHHQPPVDRGSADLLSPPVLAVSGSDIVQRSNRANRELTKSLSSEELSVEMANLEGLMKDLSTITQQDFQC